MIRETKKPIINIPSQSPEDGASGLLGGLKLALNKTLQNLDCCLPAKIVSFDRQKNRAVVEPLYKVTSTGGETHPLAKIAGIPTLLLGGGDVFISFDLKEGDLGWIIANDQDISLFLQSYEASPGNTKRMHSFSDAVFIPDLMRGYKLATEPTHSECVLQSKLGETVIGVSDKAIRINCVSATTSLVYVFNVDLQGLPNIKIPKNTKAKSNGYLFKLESDITLNESGYAKGNFVAVEYGEYICPANTLTEIVDPIEGWQFINNPDDGKIRDIIKGGELNASAANITIKGNKVNIEGDIHIKGNIKVEGNVLATGQIQGNTQ